MREFTKVKIRRGFKELKPIFKDVVRKGGMFCGGYARYCASPLSKPKKGTDVDIYCKTEKAYKILQEYFKSWQLSVNKESEVALLYYKASGGYLKNLPPIQLIKPINQGAIVATGNIRTILRNFDFTVIRCAILSEREALVDTEFEKDETLKYLRIKNIHCPISSTIRFCKYYKKGYHTSMKQIIKLFMDWDGRPSSYRNRIITLTMTNGGDGPTRQEIEELEKLLRVD